MSSTADNKETHSAVDGIVDSAALTDHAQEAKTVTTPDTTVDGADKPAEAEGAATSDTAEAEVINQSPSTDGAPNDQKPQDASDKAGDSTAVVEAEKPDPTTEQLDRYKRSFKIWSVPSCRGPFSKLSLSLSGIPRNTNGSPTIDLLMWLLPP